MNGRILAIAATGYCCATISARWWPSLPSAVWQCCLLLTTVITLVACFGRHYYTAKSTPNSWWWASAMLAGLCTGSLWAASLGQSYLTWQQLGGEIQQDVAIEGRIAHYQVHSDLHRITLESVTQEDLNWPASTRLLLNYYRPDKQFRQGQRISAQVRIKPARAVANPSGFDAQQWYVSQQIVKTGYVRSVITLIEPDLSLRGRLQMQLMLPSQPGGKWLNALLFGDRQQFTAADWDLLQRTGTAHLFAISGLHLMIVAAFSLLIVRGIVLLAGLARIPLLVDFRSLSIIGMLCCCGFYGYLAHWQIAVVRAFIMVAIGAVLFLMVRRVGRLQILTFTLALNIALTPYAIYGSALYLSIGAVVIILVYYWRWQQLTRLPVWLQCILLQLALTIGMIPLVGGLLGQISLISPLINLVLVPAMSLLIVPGCMLGLLLSAFSPLQSGGDVVLMMTGRFIEWIMQLLVSIDNQYADWIAFELIHINSVLFIGIVLCLALLPAFWGRKRLILVVLLATSQFVAPMLWQYDRWQLHFFDVGQGSATLITKRGKAILIDTGAGYGNGSNYVERVIQPFLVTGNYQLTEVFLSHLDNDHAGGLAALQRLYPGVPVVTPDTGCNKGLQRTWQELQLTVLWPPSDRGSMSENNNSCVLLVSDGKYSVLLPGDIEQEAESALLAQPYSLPLHVDVLLAPHHGSNSSSSASFVAQVVPRYVVYSQGWLNRWGFPDKRVRARYQQHGANELLISQTGYVRLDIGNTITAETFRSGKSARWFHKSFSN